MTELAETELISPLLDGFAMGNPMRAFAAVLPSRKIRTKNT